MKIILHGGNTHHDNKENNSFFKEILKPFEYGCIKVLLVYFAKESEDYESLRERNEKSFNNATDRPIQFEVANEQDFIKQIERANVVYLHGGKTLKLLEILKKYPDLKEKLKGKVVAGESAGTYVLSKWFYSKSENGLYEGLGFVRVMTICHYEGKNEEKLREALEYDSSLEELLLKDYQYKTFTL